MKLTIKTSQKALQLRRNLQAISNVSYAFSKLNQNYPLDNLSEEDALELIKAYEGLLNDTGNFLKNND
jgi:hypothetical protein